MSNGLETDALLAQAVAGNGEAFDALFQTHRRFLRGMIDRRLDPRVRARVDASDVVQDAQLVALQSLQDYVQRNPMPFRLWLVKTTLQRLQKTHRFHLATQARAADREASLPEQSSIMLAERLIDGGTSPSNRAQRSETLRQVRETLKCMSDADREIILFRLFEGLSNSEVACLLSLSEAAAKKRYARALLRIRRDLVANGVELSNNGDRG